MPGAEHAVSLYAVTEDPELAAAVADRAHWEDAGPRAVRYAPPGMPLVVLVQPIRMPTKRERYVATLRRGDVAVYSRPAYTAVEAVAWAERVPLTGA